DFGTGTAFKMTPTGTVTVLHSFDSPDGVEPRASLIQATDGNFYGTTYFGPGVFGSGTVFRMTADGTLTVLHVFTGGADGGSSSAAVIPWPDGNFYGTSRLAGPSHRGAASQLAPARA